MAELDGTRVGNYRILRRIGGGGMGDVYLAEQSALGRQVVVKVMRADESTETDAEMKGHQVQQFMQEARAIAALDHPHILSLFDYGEEGNIRYLVMPYVPDGSLADMLAPEPSPRLHLPLPPPFVAEIITQTADALQFAHDHGIVHRDVKPGNLLLQILPDRQTGQTDHSTFYEALPTTRIHVVLADFGLARFLSEVGGGTASIGTPRYSAPEQYQGRPVPATDQYALACVAYQLLTGQPVFSGTVAELYHQHLSVPPRPATQVNALLPPAVDTALLRALAKDPDQRFPRIVDFAQALNASIVPASLASRPLPLRANTGASFRPPAPAMSLLPPQVAASPDPVPRGHPDGLPAALPEARKSRQHPVTVISTSSGQGTLPAPSQEQTPARPHPDAPGALIRPRSHWGLRWPSLAHTQRRLIVGSAALLVVILLGSLAFVATQRRTTVLAPNDSVVRITRTGSVDIRKLPILPAGKGSPPSSVLFQLQLNEAQAMAQGRAADHLTALPVLPQSAPELAAGASLASRGMPAGSLSGLGQSDVGATAPLDTSIAGTSQYVLEAVDGDFQIVGLGSTHSTHVEIAAASLFKPVFQPGDTLGEPRVFFDSASQRWIVVMNEVQTKSAAVSKGFFDLAVSGSNQPTASWSVYQFSTIVHLSNDQVAEEDWVDDPQIGNDSQAFYITGNLFTASTESAFLGSVVYDVPKREFAAGRAPVGSAIYILTGFANQQKIPVLGVSPAQTNGSQNIEWLVSNDAGYVDDGQTSNRIIVWVITNPAVVNSGKLPSLVGVVVKLPLAYADPPMPMQRGSSIRLSNGDARFAQVYFASGHLYGAFTTAVNWAGDTATRSGIYWLDLVPTFGGRAAGSPLSVSVAQIGIYGFAGGYTFDPALVPTLSGDLVLFTEASSTGFYPSLVYTTRLNTDPANQLGRNAQVFVAAGSAPVARSLGSHWSDYIGGSTLLAAGNHSNVVWGAGPYSGTNPNYWQTLLWHVQIGGAN